MFLNVLFGMFQVVWMKLMVNVNQQRKASWRGQRILRTPWQRSLAAASLAYSALWSTASTARGYQPAEGETVSSRTLVRHVVEGNVFQKHQSVFRRVFCQLQSPLMEGRSVFRARRASSPRATMAKSASSGPSEFGRAQIIEDTVAPLESFNAE